MKIVNALFLISIGLIIIMFSPSYGKDGMASVPLLVTGLAVVLIGCVFIVLKSVKIRKKRIRRSRLKSECHTEIIYIPKECFDTLVSSAIYDVKMPLVKRFKYAN